MVDCGQRARDGSRRTRARRSCRSSGARKGRTPLRGAVDRVARSRLPFGRSSVWCRLSQRRQLAPGGNWRQAAGVEMAAADNVWLDTRWVFKLSVSSAPETAP